jgi:hypothetical protein
MLVEELSLKNYQGAVKPTKYFTMKNGSEDPLEKYRFKIKLPAKVKERIFHILSQGVI